MRKRPIKLHAIDNLFSLTYDPTSFFNWEACRKAKTLFVLALIMWCIPLSATVTPSTLSVRSRMTPKDITASVASNILNDTGTRAYLWADWPGVGRFGSVSPHVNRLLAATSSSGSILQLTPPSPNATYTLDFHAPSFKCENLSIALASHSNNDNSSELTTAWNSAMGKLRSLAVYTGAESRGSTQKYFFINLNGKSGQNITCRPWNTSYTTNFNWVNGVQTLTITNLTHIDVLNKRTDTIYTDFAPGEIASLSITEALMGLLTTEIGYGANGNLYGADTLLPKTGIFACPEIANSMTNNNNFGLQNSPYDCRNGSVLKTIEDLSHNFTLSLLSSSLLTERTDTVVHILEARNVYAYNRTVLVSVYGGCAFIVLLCVCVGLRSLFKNGYSANMSFSSIMLTTRDSCPELARVAADYRLPADSLHKELGDVKLQYKYNEVESPLGFRVIRRH
ncbi:uncharacterized protein K452DRAFT_315992 [Aplosporella prunicola CBS 121167]|uniref:Uncharacterized protein n=1 Tax=Aplosporella prunicola CBS 121167 TaxID=1176127 RepID=A0A6A6BSP5_9PEZI|nr:uncharacterized protein K452DRAFT_315992 [Aplosporella prunicola CBS 121167]KAF2145847.1 hypothetical protein K452DRAFT_315992 [Aplosporella prunicola CBS 121167]